MFTDCHLTLRLIRLVGEEKWRPQEAGFCFLFVRGGVGEFVAGPVSHRFAPGDVLVLNGEGGGKIGTIDNDEVIFCSVSMLVEHMFPLFSAREISLLQNLMGSYSRMKFHGADSPLAVECHRLIGVAPPQFDLVHRVHLLRVIALILGEEFKLIQRDRPGFFSVEEHLVQVFEKLSASDLLTLSVEELSVKFGCSRRHLSRLFHRHFGFSVAAMRMELRMFRAISLLRNANAKVSYVAEQCGFNHLSLFNTCFKRRFGTSPGRWRALNLKSPAARAVPAGYQSGRRSQPDSSPLFGLSKPAEPPKALTILLKNASALRSAQVATGLERVLATATSSTGQLTDSTDSVSSPRLSVYT